MEQKNLISKFNTDEIDFIAPVRLLIKRKTQKEADIIKSIEKLKDELDDSKSCLKTKTKSTAHSTKSKEKEDDLGPTKTGGSKIKMSKIGKFSDVLAGDDNPKQSTKNFNPLDLESIKNYVQEISKNSNPIGKIIDYLNDDVESMNKELQSWIKEAKNYKERYDEEVK